VHVQDAQPVVHIVGASSVEAAVDWGPVCNIGAILVLVGPQAVPPSRRDGAPIGVEGDSVSGSDNGYLAGCIHTVRQLYDSNTVRAGLGEQSGVGLPDVVVLHNADLYMLYWRRTLASLLRRGVPVVVTMYCEYEGHKLNRIFKWAALELGPDMLARCDRANRELWGDEADGYSDGNDTIPLVRALWNLEANPHAHLPPRWCDKNTHGVRNAYWMAFIGTLAEVESNKEEL